MHLIKRPANVRGARSFSGKAGSPPRPHHLVTRNGKVPRAHAMVSA